MWPLRHFCPPYIYHQSVELYAGLLHKAKRVCVGGGSAAWVRPTNNKYIAERTSNSIYSFLVNGSKKVNEVAVYVYPQKTLRIFIYIPAILIYYSHAGLEQGKKRALYYCLGNTVTLYIVYPPWNPMMDTFDHIDSRVHWEFFFSLCGGRERQMGNYTAFRQQQRIRCLRHCQLHFSFTDAASY